MTAIVVNFDDVDVSGQGCVPPGPVTSEYASLGVTFGGFGNGGGGIINQDCSYGFPAVSPPNFLGFASIITMGNGGLMTAPETLTFYPPAQSVQFDTFSFDFCEGTNVLTTQAFAPVVPHSAPS